jgi:MFS family permease
MPTFDHALQSPTRIRYGVLAFLCALAFVLYLDRLCMGTAAPRIQKDLQLSNTQMGWIHGAFLLAYGLFEIPAGRWGDRYGSRGVLVRIVLCWSAFTALTGAATGMAVLFAIRFLFGAGEAGAMPNAARVTSRWFPPSGRSSAQGIFNTAILMGGIVAPPGTQWLMEMLGWRWTFVVFGALGVVWAVAFYFWFQDDPSKHPAVNDAELKIIQGEYPIGSSLESHPRVPWPLVLRSKSVWLLGGVIACSAFASYLYYAWYPTYLQKGRYSSERDASLMTSVVLIGGALGCVLGGYLNDRLVKRTGEKRRTRRFLGCFGLTVAALALLGSIHCDDVWTAVLLTSLASFSASIQLTTWWAVVTDISGQHLGALFGLMNSMGVPGAFISELFFGTSADWRGGRGFTGREQWDPAFYVYTVVLLTGAIGWMFIDTTQSIVDKPRAQSLE